MREVQLVELGQIAANSRENLWAAAHSAGLENPLIILHWTAGHYGQYWPEDYHIHIDEEGEIYVSEDDLSEVLAHTWHLNRGTVGVTLCCAVGATTNDLGDEPPTEAQIETMAQVIAVLCSNLWLTIRSDIVMTHGEVGDSSEFYDDDDLYGPDNDCERWDLQYLGTDESPYYTSDHDNPITGGNVLRRKAQEYQAQWNREGKAL